jgi:hypothetical protein
MCGGVNKGSALIKLSGCINIVGCTNIICNCRAKNIEIATKSFSQKYLPKSKKLLGSTSIADVDPTECNNII